MLQLFKYELMALDCMGAVVIERNYSMLSLKVGVVVGLYIDIADENSYAEFDVAVVDKRSIGHAWLYTLRAVRS